MEVRTTYSFLFLHAQSQISYSGQYSPHSVFTLYPHLHLHVLSSFPPSLFWSMRAACTNPICTSVLCSTTYLPSSSSLRGESGVPGCSRRRAFLLLGPVGALLSFPLHSRTTLTPIRWFNGIRGTYTAFSVCDHKLTYL
jgi:hypothetical protein